MVGTMIEIPRAALLADEIAEVAEFFSFGTNDLTQMTLGLSRDDAGRFLPDYVRAEKEGGKEIFAIDPFVSIDQKGVGKLVKMGIAGGRSTNPKLKVGICGEHGGEAKSVKFCHAVGMNYVSCSPFRVPIARLAAAQAVIEEKALVKAPAKAVVSTVAPKARKTSVKAPEAKVTLGKAKRGRPATKTAAPAVKAKKTVAKAKAVKVTKPSKEAKAEKPVKTTKTSKAVKKPAMKKTVTKPAVTVASKRGRKPAAVKATTVKRSVGRPKGTSKK